MGIKVQLLVVAVVARIAGTCAYSRYLRELPNGDKQRIGYGHQNRGGGGSLNQFGRDFAASGYSWTADLCSKDSDGDGRTNGEELGDPGCSWRKGESPDVTTGLTHPGVADEPVDEGVSAAEAGEEAPSEDDVPLWITAHALLMVFAWVVLVPLGILSARPLGRERLGASWIRIHAFLQSTAVCLTLAGVGVAILYVGLNVGHVHTILGFTITALAIKQAVLAMLRPRKDDYATDDIVKPNALVIWGRMHNIVGKGLVVLAIVNVVLGVLLAYSIV